MPQYVELVGTESVQYAGQKMASAAEQMGHAASTIDQALRQHQIFLDEWLQRLEVVLASKS